MEHVKHLIRKYEAPETVVRKLDASNEPTQLTLFEPKEIVHPEYNIGKWAGIIFVSPHSKKVTATREYHFTKTINGEQAPASITVAPRQGDKTPTTTTLRLFVAICELWHDQDGPADGKVYFSARQIASLAGWGWSGIIAKRIEEHIGILSGATIDWKISFTKDGSPHNSIQRMKLLNDTSYVERFEARVQERDLFEGHHWVEINSAIVQNMRDGKVRPFNFKTLTSIRNENGGNLYLLIELALSNHPVFQKNARALIFDDLGLQGARYEKKFIRKQKLQELMDELDGKALVRGKIKISVRENRDKSDWVLVATREVPEVTARSEYKRLATKREGELIAEDVVEQILRLPKPGNPRKYQGYYSFLAQTVPKEIIFQALSETKGDYSPDQIKKSSGQIFLSRMKIICEERGVPFPERKNKS